MSSHDGTVGMGITGRGLLRRQSGRGWWIYVLLAMIYSLYILLDHDDFERTATWKLLVPTAVLIGQICFPTFVGWIVVFLPCVAYMIFLFITLCYVVWQDGMDSRLIVGSLFMTLLAFLCYQLMMIARGGYVANHLDGD